MNRTVTLGFTVFRPETLPFAAAAMQGCGLVVLEEPQTPGFEAMLAGEMPPHEYVLLTEFEFPEYARRQCLLLRELHGRGVRVLQLHPWLDELVGIHEFFASGKTPDDLPQAGPARTVYERERIWTAALMRFYEASGSCDFREIVDSVNAFAKEDAKKIGDMDQARAAALGPLLADMSPDSRTYVECGSIHMDMVLLLHRQLGPGRIQVRHLMEEVCKPRHGTRRLLPPGDVLTFRHLLAAPQNPRAERLLAALAVVYNKLIQKEELTASNGEYPHMENEARVISQVSALDHDDCQDLFTAIRSLPRDKALEVLRKRSQ